MEARLITENQGWGVVLKSRYLLSFFFWHIFMNYLLDFMMLARSKESFPSSNQLCFAGNSHVAVCMCVSLCSASDNIPKADEIRTLVKDIWDTRVAKLRLSADSFITLAEAHAKVWRITRQVFRRRGFGFNSDFTRVENGAGADFVVFPSFRGCACWSVCKCNSSSNEHIARRYC